MRVKDTEPMYGIKYKLFEYDKDMWLAEFISKELNHWCEDIEFVQRLTKDRADKILRILKKGRPKEQWSYFRKVRL